MDECQAGLWDGTRGAQLAHAGALWKVPPHPSFMAPRLVIWDGDDAVRRKSCTNSLHHLTGYDPCLTPHLIQVTSERTGKEDVSRKKHMALSPFTGCS